MRPPPLVEVRPEERVQQHTLEHAFDICPFVQILDALVPLMVEQLPDVLQFLGTLFFCSRAGSRSAQILREDVPVRAVLRATQLVEQLVEVPTIISYSSLLLLQVQRTVEQNVGIPVVGDSGVGGGLSSFLAGQNYSMTAEQIVDNPVLRPGVGGSFQGLHRGQSPTAFLEQIAESPDPGGGLQDFQPVQSSAASSSVSPGHAGHGVFRTLHRDKKVRRSAARWMKKCLGTSAHPRRRLMRFIMSCEMTYLWVQIMTDDEPYFWHRQEQTAVRRMRPGTHPAWVRSRDGLFFHVESGQVLPSLSGSF